jgi:hypothetical protein
MLDSFKTEKVPKPSDLTRKIEVIGAGLGRIGTMSFSAALEKLLEGPIYPSGNMLISDDECMVFFFIKQAVTHSFCSDSEDLVSNPGPRRRPTYCVCLTSIHATRLRRGDGYLGCGIPS